MLEESLIPYLRQRRWFRGNKRQIRSATFVETMSIPTDSTEACVAQIAVEYTEEEPERILRSAGVRLGRSSRSRPAHVARLILSELQVTGKDKVRSGVIYDAILDKAFGDSLLDLILRKKQLKGTKGDLRAIPAGACDPRQLKGVSLDVTAMRPEQTNSSIVYGDRFILKVFRNLGDGVNPELEMSHFLTQKAGFVNTPPLAGEIEYKNRDRRKFAVAILQDFVPNEGDAWRHTQDALSQYFDRALTHQSAAPIQAMPRKPFVDLLCDETLPPGGDLIGPYYESVKMLGRRTAELHLALASDTENPDFAPEPFSVLYQRSLYQSMRNHAGQIFLLLRKKLDILPPSVLDDAVKVVDRAPEILNRFRTVLSRKIVAKRTRIHGDYHLSQVLYTGKDYIIIDFEGDPTRPLSERRIKRSPIRDVAGMLRSFHYGAYTSLFGHRGSGMVRPEDIAALEPWARLWSIWIGSAFIKSYLEYAMPGGFLPTTRDELKILLSIYLFEKVLYELGYELENRPDWVRIPLIGILQLLEGT